MIRLEITADTPQEFRVQVVQALAAFMGAVARPVQPASVTEPGHSQTISEAPQEQVKEPTEIFPPSDTVGEEEQIPRDPPAEKAKRGRKPKAPEMTLQREQQPETQTEAPAISVDDIRDRVRQVINSCKASLPDDEKQPDAKAVEHTSKLFAKFDIKKVSDLSADRYAEFMTESEKWLNGKQG